MKKKLLIFTLCFTLIFSSLNYKKVNAFDFVISPTMLGITCALGVGAGIAINSDEDIYTLGRAFVEFMGIDKYNEMAALVSSSALHAVNGMIKLPQSLIDDYSSFFDLFVSKASNDKIGISMSSGLGLGAKLLSIDYDMGTKFFDGTIPVGTVLYSNSNYQLVLSKVDGVVFSISACDSLGNKIDTINSSLGSKPYEMVALKFYLNGEYLAFEYSKKVYGVTSSRPQWIHVSKFNDSVISYPYAGGYDPDYLKDKKEDDTFGVYLPSDLGVLVGNNSYDPTVPSDDVYVPGGSITLPGVIDPSIEVGDDITIPIDKPTDGDTDVPDVGNPSVPNEGIWSTIKDFIIGLVVPSDTYWTDTWGGLYNNFTSSFPMLDLDGFNDLVTGEKKFPNIDINIMGVTGRVVNGDVINSIVDWLRPIIAGFIMLCLMLFNYRKIYKLIRNSEPFGGIAPGTSDFSTGISEYSKQDVKVTDMVSDYRAWKERGGK